MTGWVTLMEGFAPGWQMTLTASLKFINLTVENFCNSAFEQPFGY